MVLRALDRLEEILISTLMALAVTIIFVAVVHRFAIGFVADIVGFGRAHDLTWLSGAARSVYKLLLGIKLTWAQEACIYMFVWMAKFGAAYGVRTGIHVGIDVLINRLPPARRRYFITFGLLCGAFFTGIIATLGAGFVLHMHAVSSISPDLEIQMWIIYLAIPLGSSLMCFRFLQVTLSFWRTGELPHHDHGQVEGVEDIPDDAITEGVSMSDLLPSDRDIGKDR